MGVSTGGIVRANMEYNKQETCFLGFPPSHTVDLATARQSQSHSHTLTESLTSQCHCTVCSASASAVARPLDWFSQFQTQSVVEARPKFNLRYVDGRDGSAGQFKEIRD